MSKDIAFEMAVSSVRFGVGVTREVGMDLAEIGVKLVMVVTDPVVAKLPPVRTVIDSLEQNRLAYALYDRVRVEPSDESFLDAIAFARRGRSTRSSRSAAARRLTPRRRRISTRAIRPPIFSTT